jgi:hypothetical protein
MSGGQIHDEPIAKWNHLMDDLGYLAAYGPKYHPHPSSKHSGSPAYHAYQELMAEINKKKGLGAIILGAGRN